MELPEIPAEERTPLVEALLGIVRHLLDRVHELEQTNQELRDEIAKLKKSGVAARPVALLVDEPYSLQNGAEVVEISVDIADGDQQWCRVRRGGCRSGRHSQQQHTYQMYILKNAR